MSLTSDARGIIVRDTLSDDIRPLKENRDMLRIIEKRKCSPFATWCQVLMTTTYAYRAATTPLLLALLLLFEFNLARCALVAHARASALLQEIRCHFAFACHAEYRTQLNSSCLLSLSRHEWWCGNRRLPASSADDMTPSVGYGQLKRTVRFCWTFCLLTHSLTLHARRRVDSVSKETITRHCQTNDAGDTWTCRRVSDCSTGINTNSFTRSDTNAQLHALARQMWHCETRHVRPVKKHKRVQLNIFAYISAKDKSAISAAC